MRFQFRALPACLMCLACTAAAVPALAQWYAGGNIGRAQTQMGGGTLANDLAIHGITGTGSVNNNDVGFKLYAGYQLGKSLALEGGYVNLGKFNVAGSYTRPLPAGTFAGDVKPQGANLDLVGKFELGTQVAAYLRGGAAYLNTKASAAASTAGFAGYSNASKNQVVADIGAGFQMDFSKSIAGRAEWQHFFQVGDSTTGRGDIDLFSIGLVTKF
jgi:OOP family OmpA-OmpF porin